MDTSHNRQADRGKGPSALFPTALPGPCGQRSPSALLPTMCLRQSLLIGIPAGIITVPYFTNADDAMPLIGALLLPLAILHVLFRLRTTRRQVRNLDDVPAHQICGNHVDEFSRGGGVCDGQRRPSPSPCSSPWARSRRSFRPCASAPCRNICSPNELVRGNGLCNGGLVHIHLAWICSRRFSDHSRGRPISRSASVSDQRFAHRLVIGALMTPHVAGANDPSLKLSFNGFEQTVKMFRHRA